MFFTLKFLKQYTCGVSYQKMTNYLQKNPNKKQKNCQSINYFYLYV